MLLPHLEMAHFYVPSELVSAKSFSALNRKFSRIFPMTVTGLRPPFLT